MSEVSTITVAPEDLSAFATKVFNRIKGDDGASLAGKIEKKANSAIKGQQAALDAKVVDLETAVEEAEETFANALYPTNVGNSNQNYVNGILTAQLSVDAAKEKLADANKTKEYWASVLTTYFA